MVAERKRGDSTMKKKNQKYIWIILAIAGILLVLYGGTHGWFKFNFTINPPDVSVVPLPQNPVYNSCSSVCLAQGFSKSYPFINSCQPGETKAVYGYPNQAPLLTCCCYNQETVTPGTTCTDSDGDNKDSPGHVTYGNVYTDKCLDVGQAVTEYICENGALSSKNYACDYGEVCIQSRSGGYCKTSTPTWNPGDTVFQGSGNGVLVGNNEFNSIDLSEYGITTGGNCLLGAQIQTSWSYANPNDCVGIPGAVGVEWQFHDSSGLEYVRLDPVPVSLGVDLHPTEHYLEWNGVTPWKGFMNKIPPILPQCVINYEYSVRVYIYSCS
jgi:hypothetical protein